MDYLHDRDRSLACLRTAVAHMGKHAAVLDPLSYAVWYDYAAGGSAELKQALDAATAGGALLGQETVRELFLRHIAQPQGTASLDALAQVMGLANAVSQSTDLARRATEDLGRSLTHFETSLQTPEVPASLGNAVGHMRQASAQTQDSMQQVSGLLAQHSAEMLRLKGELEQARQEAAVDGLTQVLNRRAFDRAVQGCLTQHAADGSPFVPCLLLLDIDKFKALNDGFGHAFGDDVLRAIGRALRTVVVEGDSVGRFGGDEFALLLRMHSLAAAQELAERLRKLVAGSRIRAGQAEESRGAVTISVGAAAMRPGEDALAWLQRADAALYKSKNCGRNQVSWAD
jgi:diguanylate cyclase